MVPSREAHDVLGGHLACLRSFGAVPRLGVYDQEGCIGQWRGRRAVLTDAFNSFWGVLGMGSVLCARGDPEANVVAESFWATLKARVRQPLPLRQPDGGPPRHHRVDPSLQRDPSPLLDRWRSADRVGASLPSRGTESRITTCPVRGGKASHCSRASVTHHLTPLIAWGISVIESGEVPKSAATEGENGPRAHR